MPGQAFADFASRLKAKSWYLKEIERRGTALRLERPEPMSGPASPLRLRYAFPAFGAQGMFFTDPSASGRLPVGIRASAGEQISDLAQSVDFFFECF